MNSDSTPVMSARSIRMFPVLLLAASVLSTAGCKLRRYPEEQQQDIELKVEADSIEHLMREVTDLSKPNFVRRMLALYDTGQVISAAGGRLTTRRDSIAMGLRTFWQNVGQNMQHPRWVWDTIFVDVPSTRAAVFTGAYRIPHTTPSGRAHEIGGVWTAVFAKRDGRWVIVQEHLSDWPAPPEPAADSIADAEALKHKGAPLPAAAEHTRH